MNQGRSLKLQRSHQASSLWQDEGRAEHESLDLAPSFLLVSAFELLKIVDEGFGAWDATVGVVDDDYIFAGGKYLVDGVADDLYIWIEILEWWRSIECC